MSATNTTFASVSIKGLSKVYEPLPGWMRFMVRSNVSHPVTALDGIDLEVGAGEVCAVVGPNGAGKTTAFRILVGLTTPTSGSARVMGLDCERESVSVRRVIGWLPAEDRSLLMRHTCSENLQFAGRLQGLSGKSLRARIANVLDLVGLGANAQDSVFSLSAGMRARLQLARALLHEPKVLILDEPTGSVDPVAAHDLLRVITALVEERRLAALISSHRLEEIEALGAHIVLLDEGRIRYDGDLDTLRRHWDRPALELTFESAGAAVRSDALFTAAADVEAIRTGDVSLTIASVGPRPVGSMLAAMGSHLEGVIQVREVRTPLRDILASMYRDTSPATEQGNGR